LAAFRVAAFRVAAFRVAAFRVAAFLVAGLTVAEPTLTSSLAILAFLVAFKVLINDFFWIDIAELLVS
jgi:hypothetical protein